MKVYVLKVYGLLKTHLARYCFLFKSRTKI